MVKYAVKIDIFEDRRHNIKRQILSIEIRRVRKEEKRIEIGRVRKEDKKGYTMDQYEKIKNIRNERDLFSVTNGIKTVVVKDGYGRVEVEVRPEHVNTCGTLHGGFLFTIADSASANAALADGILKTTLNSTFDFLRSSRNPKMLIGEAFEVKKGRTVCVYDTTVKDDQGVLLAKGTFTYFNLGKPVITEE